MIFKLKTDLKPAGDQPQAIRRLLEGLRGNRKKQVLLGITGSGKTFTMAGVIAKAQKPALVIAHNKTLAAQLYQEFKNFFPDNAVEYFVSYYDYYQPEAYVPRTDTYIEKDMSINDEIDRMRLSATRSLLERDDVIIVSSVSCIYGLGLPEYYRGMNLELRRGREYRRDDLLLRLVEMQYRRNDLDFTRVTFRVRGEIIDIFPAYEGDLAIRLSFFGDELERILLLDPLTGRTLGEKRAVTIYPGSHHVTPEQARLRAIEAIKKELEERVAFFAEKKRFIEKQRIEERTNYDLEMIREVGFCKGIENYSRHFSGRAEGEPPATLLDYFPEDFLTFIDESHQTIPQLHAMYAGDRARKKTLVDFGFRLPSAFDNRPLKFVEIFERLKQVIFVSATPGEWEIKEAGGEIVEQVIRPTGLLDPSIELRPAKTQVDDALEEIRLTTAKGGRILVTTLSKRLAEELCGFLIDLGINAKYMHSDIDTIERVQIIQDLRAGLFDVLVGINLLREGLDIPEVSLVLILDADKEGFLRSETSLIQTCGRAARNEKGWVIMYMDKMTKAIENARAITQKRRAKQILYNRRHNIIPKTVKRDILPLRVAPEKTPREKPEAPPKHISLKDLEAKIKFFKKEMRRSAAKMDFEKAAYFRDKMRYYQSLEIAF